MSKRLNGLDLANNTLIDPDPTFPGLLIIHPAAPPHDVIVSMLRSLWAGQHDRHGGGAAAIPGGMTQAEAESAVLMAVTLVGWFETGRVPP